MCILFFVCFYKSGPHFDEVDESFLSLFFSILHVWGSGLVTSEGQQADGQTACDADKQTETDRVC